MIKVFGVGRGAKKKQDQQSNNQESGNEQSATSNPAAGSASQSFGDKQPGEIRMQKELDELDVPPQCQLNFLNKNNIMHFALDVKPEEGMWKQACFRFLFTIPPLYPHEAPKVKCDTKIFHPNIDLEGNVCLNILREEWKPVLSISAVIYGILHLFAEPNGNDPLNQEASRIFRENPVEFERLVQRSLRGYMVQNQQFPRLL
ncbi:unnamed protein product [Amoebophrya sp. A120]|nr:unnamed protein product [Amoebophrya sp. A120]|eukprot:GSA120T00020671001.1